MGLGFMSIVWSGAMFGGVLIADIAFKFKPPPKTLEELWLEARRQEQV